MAGERRRSSSVEDEPRKASRWSCPWVVALEGRHGHGLPGGAGKCDEESGSSDLGGAFGDGRLSFAGGCSDDRGCDSFLSFSGLFPSVAV